MIHHTIEEIITQKEDILTSETESFTYDFLDRLTAVSGPYSASYSYDEIGNMTVKNGLSYTYGENGAGPHAVTTIDQTSYPYDDNGNMLVGTARTWDVENRLTSITVNGITTDFVYDGDGNRVMKTVRGDPDVTTLYINRYYEVTGAAITTYYYLGGKLIAQRQDGTFSYIHQDHLTGTSLMTDSAGDQAGTTMKYTPFGSVRSGSVDTDKLFTGQRLDATGLYYYGARYYDPSIGRFVSADAIVPNWMVPQSLNRYSYCLNNPLRYTDPSGYDPTVEECTDSNGINWGYNTATGIPNIELQPELEDVGSGKLAYEDLPVAPESTILVIGEGIYRGTGASWVILKAWSNIEFVGNMIYDSSKSLSGGSRYFHLDTDSLGQWHFNADIGLLKGFNHTPLPSMVRFARPAAKVLVVAGVVLDAIEIGSAIKADRNAGYIGFGPNTRETTERVAGGWAGALTGAAAGAAIGAAFGGIGAVPGAFIGGIVGGIGGRLAGGTLAKLFR